MTHACAWDSIIFSFQTTYENGPLCVLKKGFPVVTSGSGS